MPTKNKIWIRFITLQVIIALVCENAAWACGSNMPADKSEQPHNCKLAPDSLFDKNPNRVYSREHPVSRIGSYKSKIIIRSKITGLRCAWKALFEDENNSREILKIASFLRTKYPLDINKDNPRTPLEYALEKGIYVKLAPGLFITPITESFRRHIIFAVNKKGAVKFAFEILIPGQQKDRRDINIEKRIGIAEETQNAFPDKEYCIKPIFSKTFPAGTYDLYGEKVTFSKKQPPQIMAYQYIETGKYNNDGKRLEFVSHEMFKKISDSLGIPREELFCDIARQVAEFTAAYHSLGYIGHNRKEISNDTHLGSIRLIVDRNGSSVSIKGVGDFESFIKPDSEKAFKDGAKLDRAYLIELEYEIPNLQNILGISKKRLYAIFNKAEYHMRNKISGSKTAKGSPRLSDDDRKNLSVFNKNARYFLLSQIKPKLLNVIKESISTERRSETIIIDSDKLKDIKIIYNNSPPIYSNCFKFSIGKKIVYGYYELDKKTKEVTVVMPIMFFDSIFTGYEQIEKAIKLKRYILEQYKLSGSKNAQKIKKLEKDIKQMELELEIPLAELRQLVLHELIEAKYPQLDLHEDAEDAEIKDTTLVEKMFRERCEKEELDYRYSKLFKKNRNGIPVSLLDQKIKKISDKKITIWDKALRKTTDKYFNKLSGCLFKDPVRERARLFLKEHPEVKDRLEGHSDRGIRLKFIIEYFISGREPHLGDIADAIGISRTEIYRQYKWLIEAIRTYGSAKKPFDETFPARKKIYLKHFKAAECKYLFPEEEKKILEEIYAENNGFISRIIKYLAEYCNAKDRGIATVKNRLAKYNIIKPKIIIPKDDNERLAMLNKDADWFLLSETQPALFNAIKKSIRNEYIDSTGKTVKVDTRKLKDIKVIYGNAPALSIFNFGFEFDNKIIFTGYELEEKTGKVTVVLPFMFFAALMKEYTDIKTHADNKREVYTWAKKEQNSRNYIMGRKKAYIETELELEIPLAVFRQAVLREIMRADKKETYNEGKIKAVEAADTVLLEEKIKKRYKKEEWEYPYDNFFKTDTEGNVSSLLDQKIEELCPVKIEKEDILKVCEECKWHITWICDRLGIPRASLPFSPYLYIKGGYPQTDFISELYIMILTSLGIRDEFERKFVEVYKNAEKSKALSVLSKFFDLNEKLSLSILIKLDIDFIYEDLFGMTRRELLDELKRHKFDVQWLYKIPKRGLRKLGLKNLTYSNVIAYLHLTEIYRKELSLLYMEKKGNLREVIDELNFPDYYGARFTIRDNLKKTFLREDEMLKKGKSEEEINKGYEKIFKERGYSLGALQTALSKKSGLRATLNIVEFLRAYEIHDMVKKAILEFWKKCGFDKKSVGWEIGAITSINYAMAESGIRELPVYIGINSIGYMRKKLSILRKEKMEKMLIEKAGADSSLRKKDIKDLIDRGILNKYIKLFGLKGAYRLICMKFKDLIAEEEIFETVKGFLNQMNLGDVDASFGKGREIFSFEMAREVELPKTMERTEMDELTDEIIKAVYKNLLKDHRFLEKLEQEISNKENPQPLRAAYDRTYKYYKDIIDFKVEGLRSNVVLRLFQKMGIKFLIEKKRAVLADEMGTGKTLQAIAAALNIPRQDGTRGAKKVLIIAPNSAKNVWEREILSKTKEKAAVLGPGKKQKDKFFKEAQDARFIIINYEAVGRIKSEILDKIKEFKFDIIIYDEAHKLRNENLYWKAVQELSAEYEFALTGTPLVGRDIAKVFNVAHKLYPERFPSRKGFKMKYSYRRIKKGIKDMRKYYKARLYYRDVKDFTMRRLKRDVLPDLPPKVGPIVIPTRLHTEHRRIYDRIHTNFKKWLSEYVKREKIPGKAIILSKYIRLKQAAIDPSLVEENIFLLPRGKGGKEIIIRPDTDIVDIGRSAYRIRRDEEGVLTLEMGRRKIGISHDTKAIDINGRQYDVTMVTRDMPSAKYEALDDLINDILKRGEKVIVYSTYVDVVNKLRERYKDLGVCYLKGKMSNKARMKQIDSFQQNPGKRIMISTYTESITLTAANNVVFVDKPWTPQERDQAIDRAHRIGQKRPVNIYDIVAEDTVDERIEGVLMEGELMFKFAVEDFGEAAEVEDELIESLIKKEGEALTLVEYLKKKYKDYRKIEESRKKQVKPVVKLRDSKRGLFIEIRGKRVIIAELKDKNGDKLDIIGFKHLLESADSLPEESKMLIKIFFKKRLDYEIKSKIGVRTSFMWPLFRYLVPVLAQIDFHGQIEFEVELAMYVIYSLINNEKITPEDLLASGYGRDLNLNKVLYMLDRYNIFKALSELEVINNSYYYSGGLLDYENPSQAFSPDGKGLYRDIDIVKSIAPKIQDEEKIIKDESVDVYRREASRHRDLTMDEEIRLAREARKGNICARDALISANLGLVIKIAKNVYYSARKKSKTVNELEIAELFAEGNRELVNILGDYLKIYKEKTFVNYAKPLLRGNLTRFLWEMVKELSTELRILDKPVRDEEGLLTFKDTLEGDLGEKIKEVEEESELLKIAGETLRKAGFSDEEINGLLKSIEGGESGETIEEAKDILRKDPKFIKAAGLTVKPSRADSGIFVDGDYEFDRPKEREAPKLSDEIESLVRKARQREDSVPKIEKTKEFLEKHPNIRELLESYPSAEERIKFIMEHRIFNTDKSFKEIGSIFKVERQRIHQLEKWIIKVIGTYGSAKEPFDETYPERKEKYLSDFKHANYGYLFPEEEEEVLRELAKENNYDADKIAYYLYKKYKVKFLGRGTVIKRLRKYGSQLTIEEPDAILSSV